MRILVCGSSDLNADHHDVARTVARTIVGDTAHTLLFGGFKARPPQLSADQLFAEGAREALKRRGQNAEQRVVTVIPDDDRWDRIYLGATRTIRETDPAARRTVMVGSSDLIVSVGGKFGTSSMLNEAHRLRKPFLPLAFTGDASRSTWDYLKRDIIHALSLTGDDIAFIEDGAQPLGAHLLRIVNRVSGTPKQRLRLILVSPNDVADERDAVTEAVRELNEGMAHVLSLQLEVGRWETDTYPGFHLEGPQGLIDELLKIEDSDILVGIFGTRFGTPTQQAGSGTEHEIRTALASWRATRCPHVMVYFREVAFEPRDAAAAEQWARVQAFRRELEASGLLGSYTHTVELEQKVRQNITRYLRNRFFS
ncbi:MAG TPA: DUF4062 domain-containing protein [Thermoanaerobaculia bacterium]|nr:DUF4062 domain-containing protein [Thermoanaerobaculia bacterium]